MSIQTVYLPDDERLDEPVILPDAPAPVEAIVEPTGPKPPRVPCREALPSEVPPDAQALFDLAAASRPALFCRMTYAMAGDDRPQPDKGKCGVCSGIVNVNADGSMRSHNWPRKEDKKCAGIGAAVFAGSDGKAECEGCQQRVKVTKKGALGSHNVLNPVRKCDSLGGAPEVLIPQKTLLPIESLVLRLAWAKDCYAIGCWNDGVFEVGFVYSMKPILDKKTGEKIGDMTGALPVKITEYTAYVRAQSEKHL